MKPVVWHLLIAIPTLKSCTFGLSEVVSPKAASFAKQIVAVASTLGGTSGTLTKRFSNNVHFCIVSISPTRLKCIEWWCTLILY